MTRRNGASQSTQNGRYASLAINELRLAKGHGVEPHDYLGKLEEHNARREDALDTVMRVLLYRAAKRKGEVKS